MRNLKSVLVSLVLLVAAVVFFYGCGSSGGGGSNAPQGMSFGKSGYGRFETSGTVRSRAVGILSTTVSGYVYNVADGSAIEGAVVYATSGTTIHGSAETNASGAYTLTGVPTGEIVFTFISPNTSQQSMSIPCSCTGLSVWMPAARSDYQYASLSIYASDEAGNPIAGAKVCIGNYLTYSTFSSSTDAYGHITVSAACLPGYLDEVDVLVGKAGVGGGYVSNATVSLTGTTTVCVTVHTPASASGSISSLFAYDSYTLYAGLPNSNCWWTLFPSIEQSYASGSYSGFILPSANTSGDYLLFQAVGGLTAATHPTISYGYHYAFVSPSGGSSVSQNFSVPGCITSYSISTAEAGDLIFVTASWTAPTDWTPEFYLTTHGVGIALTPNTSITFPISTAAYLADLADASVTYYSVVWAMDSSAAVDFDSTDSADWYIVKGAMGMY